MATQSLVSDPLSELNGPLLFPGTVMDSLNDKDHASLPDIPFDLESIHTFMKSQVYYSQKEQKIPEKLKNDAMRIVNGGAEHLESSIVGNVSMIDAIASKVKERPQERRPGLNLARKRGAFTLRTKPIQPSLNLDTVLNIDGLEDPDAYFDACDKHEKAKKEIQKQMGGGTGKLDIRNLPPRTRVRKPGILGKTYDIKHRYSVPIENDCPAIISKEKEDHVTPSAHSDNPQDKSIDLDSNSVADLEEAELAASVKKTGSDLTNILDELLSCNEEDLDGDGALNMLQERLNIKPLDMESLRAPEFRGIRRFSILSAGDGLCKSRKSSHVIDSALKHLNKSPMGNELVAHNPVISVSSPTPPRSPFGSLNFLTKKILQSNPLNDRFSPFDVDISEGENVPTVQPMGKLQEQGDTVANLSMHNSELNPPVEVENTEKTYHMDAQKGIESDGDVHDQFVDENASVHRENIEKRRNEASDYSIEETMSTKELSVSKNSSKKVMVGGDSLPDEYVAGKGSPTVQPMGKLQEQGDAVANLSMYNSELNPPVEVENTEKTYHMDAQKGIESDGDVHDQFVDENASVNRENVEKRRNEASDYIIEETMSTKELSVSKNSSKKVRVGGDSLPDEYVAGNGSLVPEDAHTGPNNIPDHNTEETFYVEKDQNLSNVQDVAMNCPPTGAEKQPTVSQADLQKMQEKVGMKRTRNAWPIRKSIADYGTTFDNGVRRSKRIKMRPLEYWKGERFLYGVMNDSVKLIGVKYISPEKNAANLKVKPYIPAESSEYKNLLDLAARH